MAILLGSLSGGMQPTAPTIGTATAGDTTASVAFTASSYIGKGTITYTATSSPGGLTGTSATSPIAVTGLTNGTAYTFTVVGNTNYGVASVASAASNSITPAAQGDYESIASYSITGTTSNVTFSSIPSTYKHLQIRYTVIANANLFSDLVMRFNGDSNTNYSQHGYYTPGTSANLTSYGTDYINYAIAGIQGNNGVPTNSVCDILDYSNTNKYKTVRALSGGCYDTNNVNIYYQSSLWHNNNAISSIYLQPYNTSFASGTLISLYGIKG
jgi:hypothetical protein